MHEDDMAPLAHALTIFVIAPITGALIGLGLVELLQLLGVW